MFWSYIQKRKFSAGKNIGARGYVVAAELLKVYGFLSLRHLSGKTVVYKRRMRHKRYKIGWYKIEFYCSNQLLVYHDSYKSITKFVECHTTKCRLLSYTARVLCLEIVQNYKKDITTVKQSLQFETLTSTRIKCKGGRKVFRSISRRESHRIFYIVWEQYFSHQSYWTLTIN
jgi:hypothetical protein